MKKILLLAAIACATVGSFAQCTEIFISEYVEGTFNNKAIEFYNPTANPIDLSGYQLERFSNGSTNANANQKLVLSGTIEPYDVYVFVIEKLDPDGTGTETPVWEELQDQADQFACPVYEENNTLYFNGNDAMVLRRLAGNQVIDLIGKVGQNPEGEFGGGWNDDPDGDPPFTTVGSLAVGNPPVAWTENQTMIRKPEVTEGVMSNPDFFNPALEWDTLAANTFEYLGDHVCNCNPINVEENSASEINVFPNPSNGWFSIAANAAIKRVEVYDLNGRLIHTELVENGNKFARIDAQLPKGMYLVKGVLFNNRTLHTKLIVK